MKTKVIKIISRNNENQKQHLEFLQNNIARMNQCSFSIKGWAIAIVSAFIALYAATISDSNSGNKIFIYYAIAPTTLFWILDAMYLAKEKKFIAIYNDAIGVTPQKHRQHVKLYEIPLNKYKGWKYCIINAMLSPSELVLYFSIIISLALFAIHI